MFNKKTSKSDSLLLTDRRKHRVNKENHALIWSKICEEVQKSEEKIQNEQN